VQLPQATHFFGLIFIDGPLFPKNSKPAKGFTGLAGLECFDFIKARFFTELGHGRGIPPLIFASQSQEFVRKWLSGANWLLS